MSSPGAIPVFVDTGAFYARADEDDEHHDEAARIFDGIRSGDIVCHPLYTSQAVLSEFATLALYKLGHADASRALNAILESDSVNILPVGEGTFGTAADRFERDDDQEISFVDHTSSILAEERDIEYIFAFDGDFRTLDFSLLSEAVTVPEE